MQESDGPPSLDRLPLPDLPLVHGAYGPVDGGAPRRRVEVARGPPLPVVGPVGAHRRRRGASQGARVRRGCPRTPRGYARVRTPDSVGSRPQVRIQTSDEACRLYFEEDEQNRRG